MEVQVNLKHWNEADKKIDVAVKTALIDSVAQIGKYF